MKEVIDDTVFLCSQIFTISGSESKTLALLLSLRYLCILHHDINFWHRDVFCSVAYSLIVNKAPNVKKTSQNIIVLSKMIFATCFTYCKT